MGFGSHGNEFLEKVTALAFEFVNRHSLYLHSFSFWELEKFRANLGGKTLPVKIIKENGPVALCHRPDARRGGSLLLRGRERNL